MSVEKRNILILAACQALFQSAAVLVMTLSGLVGQQLSSSDSLATLPIAANVLGTMIATIPASLLMRRFGRRLGFILGALLGAGGGIISALGVFGSSFVVFTFGNLLLGAYQGFAQFYRFAAADAASVNFRSRAISYVLAGGVVAALAGPEIVKWTKDLGPSVHAAPYLSITVLSLAAVVLLAVLDIPSPHAVEAGGAGRPLWTVVRQPVSLVAIAGAAVGYGVMILVMTATPLAMVSHHHSIESAAFVIQAHVLGMFVPSFFTGTLIQRFGVLVVMFAGALLLGIHVVVAVIGTELALFLAALVFLGVGWNFLYVGGTALLTEAYAPTERHKVQALNDFLIHGVVVAAALLSGSLLTTVGWRGVTSAALPFLGMVALGILFLAVQRRRTRRSTRWSR